MKARPACLVFALLSIGLLAVAQETAPNKTKASPAGTITGSGAAHYVAVFNGSTTIQDSTIFETLGANVGIGTTTPGAALDVNGAVNASSSFNLGGAVFDSGSPSLSNAFGGFAGNSTMTGNQNTAVGAAAMVTNTTGFANAALGYDASAANTVGYLNSALGYEALESNTSGAGNTAVGSYALQGNTTGSYNTAVGNNAGPDPDSTGLTNSTAIGANAVVSESNALVLGGTGTYAVRVGIGTTTPSNVFTIAQGAGDAISDGWNTYSSRRWKTNIRTLSGALSKVERLRGVSYDLKEGGGHEIGVIAEEVNEVVPEIVSKAKDGGANGVDYGRLTALLIEAVKEQQREIRSQRAEISKLAAQARRQEAVVRAESVSIRHLETKVRAVGGTPKSGTATLRSALLAVK